MTDIDRIIINPERSIGTVNPRIFGNFIENLGTCMYGGVYDPASPKADEQGFRTDVIETAQAMGVTNVRYPGGCFAPYYHFEDGIGPKKTRPKTRYRQHYDNPSNEFGTDEFVAWCAKVGAEPYLCVNMGTGTPEEARNWVEYCNGPAGTRWADRRVANGHPEPYGVKLWSLGNEIEGKWEQGYCDDAHDYVRRAREYAMAMKAADPTITLVACGAHFPILDGIYDVPGGRFANPADNWNREVLDELFDYVDYISIHDYIGHDYKDGIMDWWQAMGPRGVFDFLAERMRILEDAYAIMRQDIRLIQHKHNDFKPIGVALDEYNPWYRSDGNTFCPYNLADALLVAQYFNIFLRNADVATLSDMAQLVNVLPAMVAEPGTSRFYRQTVSFVPQMFLANRGKTAVDAWTACGRRPGEYYPDVPLLDVSASYGDCRVTLNIVNLDADHAHDISVRVLGGRWAMIRGFVLTDSNANLDATNDFEHPETVAMHPYGLLPGVGSDGTGQGGDVIRVPPASLTVLELAPTPSTQGEHQ